jgi:hypothetical protein
MSTMWVDCYIDKLLTLYPQVKPYAAMIDRWAFIPEWTEAEVTFDLTGVLYTEQKLIELYGIRRQFHRGWIDETLRSGLQVLLPCDLYLMPHAKVFYGNEHAGHYILVQRLLPNGDYWIFDDHPAFSGEMACDALQRAHEAMNLPYQSFEPGCNAISDDAAIRYVSSMLQPASFHLGSFAQRLLASDLPPIRKCAILKGTRHMQHRLSGLIRMLDTAPFPASLAPDISDVRQTVMSHIDGWRATVNLALKGLLLPVDTVWSRLEQRLAKHKDGDLVLTEAVNRFHEALVKSHSVRE